jgi:hypothetical protein
MRERDDDADPGPHPPDLGANLYSLDKRDHRAMLWDAEPCQAAG